jgi:glycosyltransferase domain-containing protein
MKKATVTVLMPNYNHGHYLPESLGAICGQTRPADEVIVIDDGSTDDSVAIIEEFARRHPTMRFLRNERNLGVQASIARALPLVSSDYLVCAAADDRLLPAFLEKSMAPLERHPQAGLCFSELSVLKGDTGEIQRFADFPWVRHIYDLSDLPEFMPPAALERRMRRAYLHMTSNSVIVRRDALLASGGFPAELEWYADSFAYTVVALRYGACVLPETLALIRAKPGSYSQSGIHDRVRQSRVLVAMLDLLARPEYRDIRGAFRRCPSNLLVGQALLLNLLLRRMRDWDLFLPYLICKTRDYKRTHELSWPGTFARLGLRLFASMGGLVGAWIREARVSRRRPLVTRARKRSSGGVGWAQRARPDPMTPPRDAYTLIVTTYNRAGYLSRLLDYLEREAADFPVLVLDSSADPARVANAERIGRSPLAVRHATYPPELHPYLKVREGVQLVATRYCSICADDDMVLLEALRTCVGVLENRSDVCAAHGLYFNFSEADFFDLSQIMYRGASLLARDPVTRLRELFANYEAVFYAVYRTPVLQTVFRRVGELHTVFGRELVPAALTAVLGKVIRIGEFYYGRNTGDSLSYDNWHPYQFLAGSPELLFQEGRRLREIVLGELANTQGKPAIRERAGPILDLIFLRYLVPFLRADVVDLIMADRLKGMAPPAAFEHVWHVFVRRILNQPRHPAEPLMGSGGAGFAPDQFQEGDKLKDYVLSACTAWEAPRTYRVFHEFLFPDGGGRPAVGRQELLHLLERLNRY